MDHAALKAIAWLALWLALACDSRSPAAGAEPAEPREEPRVEPRTPATPGRVAAPAEPAPAEAATLELAPYEAPGPMRFEPPTAGDGKLPHDFLGAVDPEVGTMANHLLKFGWSPDSKRFMACGDDLDEGKSACTLVEVGGGPERLRPDDARQLETYTRGPKRWRYGADITFTWSAEGMKLTFGGELGSGEGKQAVLSWRFDAERFEGGEVYPEVVSLSPDGELLAVVGHASLGEVDDEWVPQIIAVNDFAAQVYGGVGFARLEARDYAGAETWFARAAALDEHWKHPYNLACARALGGAAGVEPALQLAIERGGDAVVAKAREDGDLDAVREQPWFAELVGG